MADEGDRQESRGETDGERKDPRRDLGAGHPLSPDTDGSDQPPPSDIDTLPTDTGIEEPTAVPDTDTSRETADATPDGDGSGVSRRDLLLGGGAGAVAASLGWAAVLGVGGDSTPGGAEGVAVDYVNAVADNDWAAAGDLFHDESRFGRENVSYDEWLQQQGQFDTYSAISPSVDDNFTFQHITDPEQAAEAGEPPRTGELDPAAVEAVKSVVVLASVQQEGSDNRTADAEYIGISKSSFSFTLVDDDGWQILDAFGAV